MPAHRTSRGTNRPPTGNNNNNNNNSNRNYSRSSFHSELAHNIALMNNSLPFMSSSSSSLQNMHSGPRQPYEHQQFQYGMAYTPPQLPTALPSTMMMDTRPSTAPHPTQAFATSSRDRERSQSLAPPQNSFDRAVSPAAARGSVVPSREASRAPSPAPFATPSRPQRPPLPRSSPYTGTSVPPRPVALEGENAGPSRSPLPVQRISLFPPTAGVQGTVAQQPAAPMPTLAPSSIDPRLLATLPRGYASVDPTPNEMGFHLVVMRKHAAEALTMGIPIPMVSHDGKHRVTATHSQRPSAEVESEAIARAKASLQALESAGEYVSASIEAAAANTLLKISTPRDATFGARLYAPPLVKQENDMEVDASAPTAPALAPPRPTKAGKMPRSSAPPSTPALVPESPASTTSSLSPVPQILSPNDDSDGDDEDDDDDDMDDDGDDYVPPGTRRRVAHRYNKRAIAVTTKTKAAAKTKRK